MTIAIMDSAIIMTDSIIAKYTSGEKEFDFADMDTLLDATSAIENEFADNVNFEATSTTTEITAEEATLS